jgi:hypothetical protein
MNYFLNHSSNLKLESPACEDLWFCCFTQLEYHNSRSTVLTNHLETPQPLQSLQSHRFLPFSLLCPCISLSEMIFPTPSFHALIIPTTLMRVVQITHYIHTYIHTSPALVKLMFCGSRPRNELVSDGNGLSCSALPLLRLYTT